MTSPVLISERDFTTQIRDISRAFGYWRHHHWLSKNSSAGWPDEVLLRPPRAIFAELKAEKGKLTQGQEDCLELLARCGLETYVWRPSLLNEIVDCLRPRLRPPGGPGKWETARRAA